MPAAACWNSSLPFCRPVLEANAQTCPTGRILGVEDTPFDFRAGKLIGTGLQEEDDGRQLAMAHGYDHCFVLDKQPGQLALAAKAYAYKTGICMRFSPPSPACSFTRQLRFAGRCRRQNGRPACR